MKKILLCAIALSFIAAAPFELLPTLPREVEETRFVEISKAFEQRWKEFSKGVAFKNWKAGKADAELVAEYEELDLLRRKAWFEDPQASPLISRPEFMVAQDLLAQGLYRNLNTLGFAYNRTDDSYNSSTLVLDGFRFLALEGPKPEHVRNFYNLLVNHRVARLVRLTPAYEGKVQVSAPYWEGKVQGEKDSLILKVPQSTQGTGFPYPVEYFAMEDWMDNAPGSPEKLLALVKKVRASAKNSKELLACHCSSGVSRTGTFLAAFLLLNEIDQKLKELKRPQDLSVSAQRTVLRLSLLRPHAVGKPLQYVTLNRLLDLYVKEEFARAGFL